ncbi:MAG TPA: HAMP domain-containing sensor histidine kinase [Balneolales bacterium]|nr:HAMP domain-containing sensor histidine kinase [Balneolales bacterium]
MLGKEGETAIRNDKKRLAAVKSVQLRDAAPLMNLEKLVTTLAEALKSDQVLLVLSLEEDVTIASSSDNRQPITLSNEEEDLILSGEPIYVGDHYCVPYRHRDSHVGYLAVLVNQSALDDKAISLIHTFASMVGKDLEMADMNAKLQIQNEKISQKQKRLEEVIAFKNNVLSITTHDLRSPLTAVLGYLDMMDKELLQSGNSDLRQYHAMVQMGVNNMADLVNQLNDIVLIDLNKIELNLIKVDLNWVAEEVYELMQGAAHAKEQELLFRRHGSPLYAEVDIPKAKRILFNLISNALKYTPRGGKIEISLDYEEDTALIHVRDNGMGIEKEKQKSIFEPFYKASESGTEGEPSTGIGLFTCYYLSRLFDGSVFVSSDKGKGAMFTLRLPAEEGLF